MARDDEPAGPPGPPPVLGVLNEVLRRYGQAMVDAMAARGVEHSVAESRLMGTVPEDGIRLTDLADRLGVAKQSCAQMVDDLVARGFLEKRPDPSDGRAKLIAFGPEGVASLEIAWSALREVEDQMAEAVGREGVEQLRRLLAGALRAPGDVVAE